MNPFNSAKRLLETWFSTDLKVERTFFVEGENEVPTSRNVSQNRIREDILKMKSLNTDLAWEKIASRIEDVEIVPTKKIPSTRNSWWRYAAAFIVTVGLGVALKLQLDNDAQNNPIEFGADLATLTIDGEVIEVPKGNTFTINDEYGQVAAMKGNNRLVYSPEGTSPTMHHLKVPNGNRITVLLADGTKVHCDSGSSLSYPSSFVAGETREVTLKGQAYFDVTEQGADKFLVHTQNTTAEVTCTQFNMAAYPETQTTDVVLVKGVIKVGGAKDAPFPMNERILLPGQRMSYNKALKRIHVASVNTYNHTAWVSGKLIFEGTPFKNILKTLERNYNVTIENHKAEIANTMFRAKFDNENLEDILEAFQKNTAFSYAVEENTIVIQ
ncbi:MAG: FecR family protein [Croceivirga sp.]